MLKSPPQRWFFQTKCDFFRLPQSENSLSLEPYIQYLVVMRNRDKWQEMLGCKYFISLQTATTTETNLHDFQTGFIRRLLCKLRMLVRNTNNLNSVTLIKCILIFNLAFKKSASSDLKTSDMTNLKIYRNFFIEESPNLSVQFQVGSLEAKQKPILSFKFRVNVWCSLA